MSARSFRAGLRVADVAAAVDFYSGLGFEEVMRVPNPEGRPVFAILTGAGVHLCLDALQGMPFPDTERERLIQQGPRGLGTAFGLGVDDLAATYEYCTSTGCAITSEPEDAPWGDRVFECTDPFGYVWEISQPMSDTSPSEATEAVQRSWFGPQQTEASR